MEAVLDRGGLPCRVCSSSCLQMQWCTLNGSSSHQKPQVLTQSLLLRP